MKQHEGAGRAVTVHAEDRSAGGSRDGITALEKPSAGARLAVIRRRMEVCDEPLGIRGDERGQQREHKDHADHDEESSPPVTEMQPATSLGKTSLPFQGYSGRRLKSWIVADSGIKRRAQKARPFSSSNARPLALLPSSSKRDVEDANGIHAAIPVGDECEHRRPCTRARLRAERFVAHRLEWRGGISDDRRL